MLRSTWGKSTLDFDKDCRWLPGIDIMGWSPIYGVAESYSTRCCVVICHSKIRRHQISTRRFWMQTIIFLSSCRQKRRTSYRKFSRPIQRNASTSRGWRTTHGTSSISLRVRPTTTTACDGLWTISLCSNSKLLSGSVLSLLQRQLRTTSITTSPPHTTCSSRSTRSKTTE